MKRKLLIIGTLIIVLTVSGCGVVKGCGRAVGYVCQGVGAIGEGIEEDLTAASDGHSNQYYYTRTDKNNRQ
jgi:hypothetical protein